MKTITTLALFLLLLCSTSAQGTFQFTVHPTGAEEIPPNNSINGAVPGIFNLSGATLTYGFSVLPMNGVFVLTRATVNGPAGPGVVAPTIFDLGAPTAIPNPPFGELWHGTINGVTSSQIDDLLAGLWYVNVFSDTSFPDGQYRGQITLVPEPMALPMVGLAGVTVLIWRTRKRWQFSET